MLQVESPYIWNLLVIYLKATPFCLNSTYNRSGTEEMVLSHSGLPKVAEPRGQWKESSKICIHTYTHSTTRSSSDGNFAFWGQLTQQEGNGAGGTKKLEGLLGWAALHTSCICQPEEPSFSLHCVSIQGYSWHPVPVVGEEGRRNRRGPDFVFRAAPGS